MKALKQIRSMMKCKHHFIPQYQLAMIGGVDKVNVSKCKCGRYMYRSYAKVLREGAKK